MKKFLWTSCDLQSVAIRISHSYGDLHGSSLSCHYESQEKWNFLLPKKLMMVNGTITHRTALGAIRKSANRLLLIIRWLLNLKRSKQANRSAGCSSLPAAWNPLSNPGTAFTGLSLRSQFQLIYSKRASPADIFYSNPKLIKTNPSFFFFFFILPNHQKHE